jgi:hypothetical protein
MLKRDAMYDFLMKEMYFSQQMTNIGTSRFISNHRQRGCHRMVDSIGRSDAQGADATPPWNLLYISMGVGLQPLSSASSHSNTEYARNIHVKFMS